MDNLERILCSAIWYNDGIIHISQPKNINIGYVLCGYRHNNIIYLNSFLNKTKTTKQNSIQGFITNNNKFVDRYEAMMIAKKSNQIISNTNKNYLTSEDLY